MFDNHTCSVNVHRAHKYLVSRLLRRCFLHWHTSADENRKNRMADGIHRQHMLRKGLQGFSWAIMRSKHQTRTLRMRVSAITIRAYFCKVLVLWWWLLAVVWFQHNAECSQHPKQVVYFTLCVSVCLCKSLSLSLMHKHRHTHARMRTHTHSHTHIHTHSYTHALMNAHTHTHIHTFSF